MLKIKRQDIWILKLQLTTLKQQCKTSEQFGKRLKLPIKEKQRKIAPIYRHQQRCIILNDQIFYEFRELRKQVQKRLLDLNNRKELIKMNQDNQCFLRRQCSSKVTELIRLRKPIY